MYASPNQPSIAGVTGQVPQTAPRSLDYNDVLPRAIRASSNRQYFSPENGGAFSAAGTSTIRINVNSDSFLNPQASYLQYTITNNAAAGDFLCLDNGGIPWCSRLRIESAGVSIEDIEGYNRLMAMLSYAQYSPAQNACAGSVSHGGNPSISTVTGDLVPTYPQPITSAGGIASGASRTFCVPLVSALLNCPKLIPLALTNAGITLIFELADNNDVGFSGTAAGPPVAGNSSYSISDVRYVAHLVTVDAEFVALLRSEMMREGNMLTLHGQTWSHYAASLAQGVGGAVNIPCRSRSIKSVFTTQNIVPAATNAQFNTSAFQRAGLSAWQYRVGSTLYPQTQVRVTATNLSESFCETQKALGVLGSTATNSSLSLKGYDANTTEATPAANAGDNTVGEGLPIHSFFVGYDFDAFANTSATNSGVDTAERALQINFECTRAAGAAAPAVTLDSYVCSDLFVYVGADGALHPSE